MPSTTNQVLLIWWETPQLWKDSQKLLSKGTADDHEIEEQTGISGAGGYLAELSREENGDTEEEYNNEDIERGDNDEDSEEGVLERLENFSYHQETGSL